MRNVKFKIQIELNKNQGEGGMADTGYRYRMPAKEKRIIISILSRDTVSILDLNH